MTVAQALYRFYDADGELLYVGITMNPGTRWKKHASDKPWWSEVANITVETYPDRESVLAAEKSAIVSERPRYNVVHNEPFVDGVADSGSWAQSLIEAGGAVIPEYGTTEWHRLDGEAIATRVAATVVAAEKWRTHECEVQPVRTGPFQIGDWVALGLNDGRCPLGLIEATDNEWVTVRPLDPISETVTGRVVAVRWSDVVRAERAYDDTSGSYLGAFQVGWERTHLPDGDPVEVASGAYWPAREAEFREAQQERAQKRLSEAGVCDCVKCALEASA